MRIYLYMYIYILIISVCKIGSAGFCTIRVGLSNNLPVVWKPAWSAFRAEAWLESFKTGRGATEWVQANLGFLETAWLQYKLKPSHPQAMLSELELTTSQAEMVDGLHESSLGGWRVLQSEPTMLGVREPGLCGSITLVRRVDKYASSSTRVDMCR